MRAFLIDFENVKSAGLVGIDTLGIDDQVVILYSVNSNTISFEMHQKIMSCAANVEYYQIRRGGKNSLDFQLSTMLGYLLASGLYTHLYIVSNDSGFDALYDFWTSGYLPTDCVVYRRPNIAMSVAHSVFTGKPITPNTASDVHEVDVTVTDSAAYQQFEMERETASETDGQPEEIVEIIAEQQNDSQQSEMEASDETDDFETAALLGALQAAQQQEAEEEQKNKAGWEETEAPSAAARMRQAELDAEEEESYIPSGEGAENAEAVVIPPAPEETSERSRRRRGRPRRSERAQEQQTVSVEKPRQKADPAEVASLAGRLESELSDVCSREQRMAVAEEILLAEGKQEFYRGIIRRFGQKRGLLVYKAVKSDFSAFKKK